MMDVGMIEVTGAVGMMPISEGWRRRDGGETEEGNLRSSQLPCPTSPPPPRAGRRRLHVGEGRCCKGHHARRHLYTRLLAPNPSLSIVEREYKGLLQVEALLWAKYFRWPEFDRGKLVFIFGGQPHVMGNRLIFGGLFSTVENKMIFGVI
jgi:hypothetical protein